MFVNGQICRSNIHIFFGFLHSLFLTTEFVARYIYNYRTNI